MTTMIGTLLRVVVVVSVFSACGKSKAPAANNTTEASSEPATKKPATTPKQPPVAPACSEGQTRCAGKYTGKLKAGNRAPIGGQALLCKAGKWIEKEACDMSKNMGCYMIDDPAADVAHARCVSTFSGGE